MEVGRGVEVDAIKGVLVRRIACVDRELTVAPGVAGDWQAASRKTTIKIRSNRYAFMGSPE
jgi:hypothetical protein